MREIQILKLFREISKRESKNTDKYSRMNTRRFCNNRIQLRLGIFTACFDKARKNF